MWDELVRSGLAAAFLCVAVGLSGCNGCRGCEGQTIEPAPQVAPSANVDALPNVMPSSVDGAPDPSSMAVASASAVPNPEHDPTGMRRCCKAISENLETAPDKHKATWKSALDACNKAIEKQSGRKELASVREILTPLGWPSACQ